MHSLPYLTHAGTYPLGMSCISILELKMQKYVLIVVAIGFAAILAKTAFNATDPAVQLVKNRPAAIEAKLEELTR